MFHRQRGIPDISIYPKVFSLFQRRHIVKRIGTSFGIRIIYTHKTQSRVVILLNIQHQIDTVFKTGDEPHRKPSRQGIIPVQRSPCCIPDVAARNIVQPGCPQHQFLFENRNIHETADFVLIEISRPGRKIAIEIIHRFFADVMYGPGRGVAAEKCPLRTFQHVKLLHVEQCQRCASQPVNRHVIVKHRNAGLGTRRRFVAGYPAKSHFRLNRAQCVHPGAGDKLRKFVQISDPVFFQKFRRKNVHGDRDIQQLLIAFLCGHRMCLYPDRVFIEREIQVILPGLQMIINRFGFVPGKRNLDTGAAGGKPVKKVLPFFIDIYPFFGFHHYYGGAGKQVVVVVSDFPA